MRHARGPAQVLGPRADPEQRHCHEQYRYRVRREAHDRDADFEHDGTLGAIGMTIGGEFACGETLGHTHKTAS
jgi:hypothetical protein